MREECTIAHKGRGRKGDEYMVRRMSDGKRGMAEVRIREEGYEWEGTGWNKERKQSLESGVMR